jgi:protein TonB
MFEDSTFESTGRIRTRRRGWMMAAFVFNGSILLALILIPLIYPEALPRQMMSMLLEAPPPPPPQQPAPPANAQADIPRRPGDGPRATDSASHDPQHHRPIQRT